MSIDILWSLIEQKKKHSHSFQVDVREMNSVCVDVDET